MGDDATVTFKSHDSNLMIDVAAPPLRLLSHLRTWTWAGHVVQLTAMPKMN